jgi:hypothetical protein
MYILSKSEIQFLQWQKKSSKSYGYKARTIFTWANEMDTTMFPDIDLTDRIIPRCQDVIPWDNLKGCRRWLPRVRLNGNDLYEQ